MAQTAALLTALKKQLKAHGLTYADLAKVLQLSEASVKRLFAEQNFTLVRLEIACQMMGLQLQELVALIAKDQPQLVQLSEAQENDIVSDCVLLMVSVSIINGYTFKDLLNYYRLSEPECIAKLVQ